MALPEKGAVANIKGRDPSAKLLRKMKVLIWDEAPTALKAAVDAVDKCLRNIMDTPDLPFRWKVILHGQYRAP